MTAKLKPVADAVDPKAGIAKDKLDSLASGLESALADSYVLMVKTHAVYWNVVGPIFFGIHKMTEEQYEDLFDAIDALAERIRSIGRAAPMSFHDMQAKACIDELNGPATAETMLAALEADHTAIANRMRDAAEAAEECRDFATHDLIVARIAFHETAGWMLRSIAA